MKQEVVIVKDFGDALLGILPWENFKSDFKDWFELVYRDGEIVHRLEFDTPYRFEKYEQVELKVITERGNSYHLLVHKSSVESMPEKMTFYLDFNEYESMPIAVVEASNHVELHDKCLLACKEELSADDDSMEIDKLIDIHQFDWGVSSAFNFSYKDDGQDSVREIRITKIVKY